MLEMSFHASFAASVNFSTIRMAIIICAEESDRENLSLEADVFPMCADCGLAALIYDVQV